MNRIDTHPSTTPLPRRLNPRRAPSPGMGMTIGGALAAALCLSHAIAQILMGGAS